MNPSEHTGSDVDPTPLPAGLTPLMQRALELATAELGVTEHPPGSNRGPEVDRYVQGDDGRYDYLVPQGDITARGVPWCARFAATMIRRAAVALGIDDDPTRGAGDLASALKWRRWGAGTGRLRYDARPGRIGLILHSDGASGHVVMIADVDGDSVETREGNASDAVRCRRRSSSEFATFVEVG